MAISSKKLAGPGYVILNGIRAINIVCLLAVITASILMVVKTFTVSKFFFFDAATHIITASSAMILLISECSIFKNYFARDWPLLSEAHGFNFLGVVMLVIGNNTLGNLNKEATSQKSLGLPFWRLVIGSGIITFTFGFVNIVASLIFRDRKLKVTARQIRSRGAVAVSDAEAGLPFANGKGTPSIVTSFPTGSSVYSAPSPRKSPVKSFFGRARDSILPTYTRTAFTSRFNKNQPQEEPPRSPVMNISGPLNINPQFAHLIKPELAHHPSKRNDGSF